MGGASDGESGLEGFHVEDGVEGSCAGGGEGDLESVRQMEGVATEGERELEAAGRDEIEERVATEKLASGNYLSRNDRLRGGGVDDEVFCAYLGGSGSKREAAGWRISARAVHGSMSPEVIGKTTFPPPSAPGLMVPGRLPGYPARRRSRNRGRWWCDRFGWYRPFAPGRRWRPL